MSAADGGRKKYIDSDVLDIDFSESSYDDEDGDNYSSDVSDRQRTIGLDFPQAEDVPPYPKIVVFILLSVFLFNVSLHLLAECSTLMQEDRRGLYRLSYIIMAFSTLIGAYFSDSRFGVHKTCMFVLPCCFIGSVALTISLYLEVSVLYHILSYIAFTCYGTVHDLFLILALDQLTLPAQKKYLLAYVIYHKFTVAVGESAAKISYIALQFSLLCFPGKPCYIGPLVASALMLLISIMMYLVCKNLRVLKVPHGETKLQPIRIISCIFYAVRMRFRRKRVPVTHWLDRSLDKYGWHKVFESKSILRIFLLFSIVPLFWGLRYNQQTIWMNIYMQMNTTVLGHIIKPTQINYLSGICYLFWTIVYRVAIEGPCVLAYPLQNMIMGGFVSTIGFSLSALISFVVQMSRPSDIIRKGRADLRFYNPTHCDILLRCTPLRGDLIEVKPFDVAPFKHLYVTETVTLNMTVFTYCMYNFPTRYQINITERRAISYIFRQGDIVQLLDDPERRKDALPKLRVISNSLANDTTEIIFLKESTNEKTKVLVNDLASHTMKPGMYTLTIGQTKQRMFLHTGGVDVLLIDDPKGKQQKTKFIAITPSNKLTIFLNIPQYLIVFLGDTLVHVNGARLAYIEAPETLKTTFVCFWFSGQALAMIIAWILNVIRLLEDDSQNLVFISLVLLVCDLIFALLCNQYDYIHPDCY